MSDEVLLILIFFLIFVGSIIALIFLIRSLVNEKRGYKTTTKRYSSKGDSTYSGLIFATVIIDAVLIFFQRAKSVDLLICLILISAVGIIASIICISKINKKEREEQKTKENSFGNGSSSVDALQEFFCAIVEKSKVDARKSIEEDKKKRSEFEARFSEKVYVDWYVQSGSWEQAILYEKLFFDEFIHCKREYRSIVMEKWIPKIVEEFVYMDEYSILDLDFEEIPPEDLEIAMNMIMKYNMPVYLLPSRKEERKNELINRHRKRIMQQTSGKKK